MDGWRINQSQFSVQVHPPSIYQSIHSLSLKYHYSCIHHPPSSEHQHQDLPCFQPPANHYLYTSLPPIHTFCLRHPSLSSPPHPVIHPPPAIYPLSDLPIHHSAMHLSIILIFVLSIHINMSKSFSLLFFNHPSPPFTHSLVFCPCIHKLRFIY